MAIETAQPQTAYDEWFDRRWRLTGAVIALLCLATAALTVAMGEKRSDLGLLHGGVKRGSVSQVEIEGLPTGDAWEGEAVVTLRWSDGIDRYAEVKVVRTSSPGQVRNADDLPVVLGDPTETLLALNPDLDISSAPRRGETRTLVGWHVPVLAGWLALTASAATLFLLIGGPQPWRATRWAWFWLSFPLGPLAVLAFLLLGGPLGLWRPRDRHRRLTGGWAFLISLVVPFGGAR